MSGGKLRDQATTLRPTRAPIGALALLAAIALATALFPAKSGAVPAFARQTGQECAACHVGSFGPQLTTYGRNFKLNGYVWGDNASLVNGLSGMVFGGFTHTKADQTSKPAPIAATNDNWTVDQAALFYGGRITEKVGMLVQATYHNPTASFQWDNSDIRYADTAELFGHQLLYGATLNNNPTVQDAWQTTPAWAFPYVTSSVAPAPAYSPYIASGQGQRVLGLGFYGLLDDLLYVELSGYHSLNSPLQRTLGMTGAAAFDRLDGVAPYWRVALQHDYGIHYVEIGTYGAIFDRFPLNMRGLGTDTITDIAADLTYQATLGGGDHIFSAYATYLRENLRLAATMAAGGSDNLNDRVDNYRMNLSYYYLNTYGITVSRFASFGNTDATFFSASNNGKPNSSGWTVQFDVTPFGGHDSLAFPYLNARFFVQYTAYDRFNGSATNFDGNGRKAADNNTVFTGLWLAF
jgi:hypothetical protein